jgi:hypothetical protein
MRPSEAPESVTSRSVRTVAAVISSHESTIPNPEANTNCDNPPLSKATTGVPAERDSSAESPNVSRNREGMTEKSANRRTSRMLDSGRNPKNRMPEAVPKRVFTASSFNFRRSEKRFEFPYLKKSSSTNGPSPKMANSASVRPETISSKNGKRRSKPFSGTSLQKKTNLRIGRR